MSCCVYAPFAAFALAFGSRAVHAPDLQVQKFSLLAGSLPVLSKGSRHTEGDGGSTQFVPSLAGSICGQDRHYIPACISDVEGELASRCLPAPE
jgi:hypothetical protein